MNISSMTAPLNKTMLNYFTKLPSKTCTVEELNPRKLAPVFNKQHVEEFQKDRLERFDAELYKLNNSHSPQDIIVIGDQDGQEPLNDATDGQESAPLVDYIASIRTGQHKPFRVARKLQGPLRAKLLQFSEDVRPAYFGTWQQTSTRITGRRPYNKDETVFDYEVDSEAEWDIGGPGESLKGDDSEDEEELDDYEIDMKTFVPHGYVSDDEIEAHSDHEENGSSSANHSVEEIVCDQEDSCCSIKIVGEKRVKLTTVSNSNKLGSNNNGQQTNSSKKITPTTVNSCQQQTAMQLPQVKQPKTDIKPIVLGVYYESQQPVVLSESKIHFLRSFQGSLCN